MVKDQVSRIITVTCDYCPEEYCADSISKTVGPNENPLDALPTLLAERGWFAVFLPLPLSIKEFSQPLVKTYMCSECVRKARERASDK